MPRIAVIDYGMGNLRSVAKALEHVAPQHEVLVTNEPAVIARAERVVFPGQGAARDCMAEIRRLGLEPVIRAALAEKPFLGICMGLQVLMRWSAENAGVTCLGLVNGTVERFQFKGTLRLKIPHMGWSPVRQTHPHPLWAGIAQDSRFYFVHSYFVVPPDDTLTAATTLHGQTFVSALARDNFFAVQFHPEKSQRTGLQLLANFAHWNGRI